MKTGLGLIILLALALPLPVAALIIAAQAGAGRNALPPRPQGPCDIYAAAGAPCVAAHCSTRALYAAYNGPLYQVMLTATAPASCCRPPRLWRPVGIGSHFGC